MYPHGKHPALQFKVKKNSIEQLRAALEIRPARLVYLTPLQEKITLTSLAFCDGRIHKIEWA